MTTEELLDPSQTTPETEPPSSETSQPSDEETTETVEELREKLAAAQNEANRWKGRVEKVNEKKKKETPVAPADLEELKWELKNESRIEVVKDVFERFVSEGYQGEKVSKRVALELAEKAMLKNEPSATKRERQDDMSTPSVTTRNFDPKGYEDETDKMLGLTLEKKRKLEERHPHLRM